MSSGGAASTLSHISALVACAALAGCYSTGLPSRDAGPADLAADVGALEAGPADLGSPDFGYDAGPSCTPPEPEGAPCALDTDCDDGCFCTGTEECVAGICATRAVPCRDTFACTTSSRCDEALDRCDTITDDAMCDDGDVCSGVETCQIGVGCASGLPLLCDDGDLCTIDECMPGVGCRMRPRDLDADGFIDDRCGGDDCNDDPRTGRSTFPGAPEVCGDLRDQNCDRGWDYDSGACTSANDTCALTVRIPAEDGDVEGGTRGMTDDYALSCGRGGPDVVFRLFLATSHVVQLNLFATGAAPRAAGGDFAPAISIRSFASCATGLSLGCAAGPIAGPGGGPGAAAELTVTLPSGEYAVIVETEAEAAFLLRLRFDP